MRYNIFVFAICMFFCIGNPNGAKAGDIERCEQDRKVSSCNRAIRRARKRNRRFRSNLYNIRGTVHRVKKNYGLAIDDHTTAIRLNKKNYNAYQLRGMVYLKLKEFNKAASDFTKRIQISPGAAGFTRRSQAYFGLHKLEKALEDANKAVSLEPDNFVTRCMRSNILGDLQKTEKAQADFEGCLSPEKKVRQGWVKYIQNVLKRKEKYKGPLNGKNSPELRDAFMACLKDKNCVFASFLY